MWTVQTVAGPRPSLQGEQDPGSHVRLTGREGHEGAAGRRGGAQPAGPGDGSVPGRAGVKPFQAGTKLTSRTRDHDGPPHALGQIGGDLGIGPGRRL